jgi:cobalt-zinc-cadmium efflux system membrane fusion protein
MKLAYTTRTLSLALGGVAVVVCAAVATVRYSRAEQAVPPKPGTASDAVTLTDRQRHYVTVGAAVAHSFAAQSEAVGYVDFDQDHSVQVFSPWAGRIHEIQVRTGDRVRRGQTLFTVDSPELAEAEANLLTTAAQLTQARAAVERARSMLGTQAVAQKDFEQAQSDEQGAEASQRAARESLALFGKTTHEVEALLATHHVDSVLRVVSPMNGTVTARNAADGQYVQPGNAPSPVSVSDTGALWLVANVPEAELPKLVAGQAITASLAAAPEHRFEGTISNIGAAVDPATHTVPVRAEVRDPTHLLRPQMLASFRIRTGAPSRMPGVSAHAIVREGDGTQTVFVTTDGRSFHRRVVHTGLEQEGVVEILDGLLAGETVATDGALLLSNALALQSR